MFDKGAGPPLVVVPGVQGRWEWMAPALDELRKSCRTVSFSLCGEPGSGRRFDASEGFDSHVRQLEDVFARAGIQRGAVCGVSYGGLIALRFAARHPELVSALVLVSSPAPGWEPNATQRRYVARPWLTAPLFVATGPGRLWPEISAALDGPWSRLRFVLRHAARIAAAPLVPPHAARRVRLLDGVDFRADCRAVRAPTLVVTGEEALDRIVPVEVTRSYAALIAGARHVTLERTGHIGVVTQPARFAAMISGFVHAGH